MVEIAIAVVLAEDLLGLLITSLGDEPSRRLGGEPDQGALQDGGECLKDGWDSPGPRTADDTEGTKCSPL